MDRFCKPYQSESTKTYFKVLVTICNTLRNRVITAGLGVPKSTLLVKDL